MIKISELLKTELRVSDIKSVVFKIKHGNHPSGKYKIIVHYHNGNEANHSFDNYGDAIILFTHINRNEVIGTEIQKMLKI